MLLRPAEETETSIKKYDYGPTSTLSKRNCKVYADLGMNARHLTRLSKILDTDADPNFVRPDVIFSDYECRLEPALLPSGKDARN